MHTRWSDGSGTIAEMADAATGRSYEYIAITDHSKGLKIAGGIVILQHCATRTFKSWVTRAAAFTIFGSA